MKQKGDVPMNKGLLKKSRKKFKKSLKLLIESHLLMRSIGNFSSFYDESEERLYNEFISINFKSCRRAGHTETAIKVCSEFFDKVLYLGYNLHITEAAKFQYEAKYQNVTFHPFHSSLYLNKKYDCVILDCYSLFTKSEIKKVQNNLSPLIKKENFVILKLE